MTVYAGKLWFSATDGVVGNELWVSDGTAAGTTLIKDIRPGLGTSSINGITGFGSNIFFGANDGANGTEVWTSDGTAAGTVVVADIQPGTSSGSPANRIVSGGKLFFSGYDPPTTGRELYVSAGTTAGTVLVADLNPGASSSTPNYMAAESNGVYFRATAANGAELFFSEGTAGGTVEVCDISPDSVSSSPIDLMLCAGDLFFNADDPIVGKQPFTITGVGAYSKDLGLPGLGAPSLRSTVPVMGGNLTISGDRSPAGALGVFVMSGHVGVPDQALTSLFGVNWINFANLSIQGAGTTPSWSVVQSIPASPVLLGAQVNL